MSSMKPEPIAIVGFSFRLPGGATDAEKLWEILAEGRQCWTDVPPSRYNWEAFHSPDPDGKGTHNARGGFFLEQDIAEFDAQFFGVSAAEAAAIDPQQRLLLEVSYEAFENAGLPIENLRGSQTGVYVALVSRDYDRQIYKDPSQIPKHHLTGCGDATACGRISYVFDLKGPCMSVDTGCSGGMVGVHLACQALRLRESNMALVGGTNLLLGPDMTIAMSKLHMVNDNGKCYPFDNRGSGYGRAEGVAVMILKRLDDALRDGDSIRAIIRDSGIGQDGKTNGILLPSSEAQQQLAASLYARSELDPQKVGYVEAHGTGTQAGDAAEINSIEAVFIGDQSRRRHPLLLGSIKANLGHSESTSGLAGILKATLSLERNLIPPVAELLSLKADAVKVQKRGAVIIPTSLEKWPHDGALVASVNSFGFGGTNAHVILESASDVEAAHARNGTNRTTLQTNGFSSNVTVEGNGLHYTEPNCLSKPGFISLPNKHQLFVVSAKSKSSLETSIANLKAWVQKHELDMEELRNLARTLSTRRSRFSWRSSFVGSAKHDIVQALESTRHTKASKALRVVFLFTGQGAQYAGMGRQLLSLDTEFLASLKRSEKILTQLGATWNIVEELGKHESSSKVNSGELSQPATTAVQIALVDLLKGLGVQPVAVLGHSSGEVAAAYAAGAIDQVEAMTISYHKGFVASWCRETIKAKGSMLAVGLGEDEVSRYLENIKYGRATVACVNSPSSVTISGDEAAVLELQTHLDQDSVFNRLLKVDIAYHSHHMHAVSERFRHAISKVAGQVSTEKAQFFSSVTEGSKSSNFGSSYWVENLVSKVRFSKALEALVDHYVDADSTPLHFVEIGPHSALQGPVRQIMSSRSKNPQWSYSGTLIRKKDAHQTILEAVGIIFEQGGPVNLHKTEFLQSHETKSQCRPIKDLPQYAWDHSNKYWHESRLSKEYRFRQHRPHDLLGLRLAGTTSMEPVFRHILSVEDQPWLQEHIIDGFALYPGSAFLVHAIEGLRQISQESGQTKKIAKYFFKDVSFSKALVVPDAPANVELLLSLKPSRLKNERLNIAWLEFRVTSQAQDGAWHEHCQGYIRAVYEHFTIDTNDGTGEQQTLSLVTDRMKDLSEMCKEIVHTSQLYDGLRRNGIDYGTNFSIIKHLQLGHQTALGHVQIPDIRKCMPGGLLEQHVIHPALFDAFMHIALPLYHRHCTRGPVMLTHIGEASISADMFNRPGDELVVACDLTQAAQRFGAVSVLIAQDDGKGGLHEVGSLSEEEFRGIGESGEQELNGASESIQCYYPAWSPVQPMPTSPPSNRGQRIEISQVIESDFARTLASDLANHLPSECQSMVVQYRPEFMDVNSIQIIIVDKLGAPCPSQRPSAEAEIVATQLARFKSVLFVTIAPPKGGHRADPSISKLMQWQSQRASGGKFVTLEYSDLPLDGHKIIHLLEELIERCFSLKNDQMDNEVDYRYRDGTLMALRLLPHKNSHEWIKAIEGNDPKEEFNAFHQVGRALKLEFKTHGLLSSAYFVEEEGTLGPLESHDVLVKVYAHAVNQVDVAIATGRAPHTASMIGEFSGLVLAAGSAAQAKYKSGDRVCGWGSLAYANIARVKDNTLHHIADRISFAEGASIPLAFQTAYHALIDIARLEKFQRVLIHGGAGSVGQAAISLARHVGAIVYATVGDVTKKRILTENLGVPSEHVFSSRNTVFQRGVDRLTQGQGVDIVLNCCSDDLVDASLSCIGDFGVLVNLLEPTALSPMPRVRRNISIVSVDMQALKVKYPDRLNHKFRQVMALYNEGLLRPITLTTVPISDIANGFKLVQSQGIAGKVVLTADETALVKQVVQRPMRPQLAAHATYVVYGGTSVASSRLRTFLQERGATYILSVLDDGTIEQYRPKEHIVPDNTDEFIKNMWSTNPEDRPCQSRPTVLEILADMPPIQGVLELNDNPQVYQEISEMDHELNLSKVTSWLGAKLDGVSGDPKANQNGVSTGGNAIFSHSPAFFITLNTMESLWENDCHNGMLLDAAAERTINCRARILTLGVPVTEEALPCNENMQGTDLMKANSVQLIALLDYCIGAATEKEKPLDLFVFNPIKLGRVAGQPQLERKHPYLDMLVGVKDSNPDEKEHDTTRFDQRLRQATSQVQAHNIILKEICQQLAAFCALDVEDISTEAAIADIGLDSLLAIEFKNWIVRTLQAPMQTTEILDAPSLRELGSLIAQRSKLVDQSIGAKNLTIDGRKEGSKAVFVGPETPIAHGTKLPPLEIPPLKSLLERHLIYVKAFASDEEFLNTKRLAEQFQQPGSIGVRLYDRLQATKDADPEDWYHDLYLKSQYLIRKGALAPYMLFFFTHPISSVRHSQAARAALIASCLIQYKEDLERGKVKPRYMHEQQLCMDLYKNLFNTSRKPRLGLDLFEQHPGHDYFIVLRRGRVFKIGFSGLNGDLTHDLLEATFTAILHKDLGIVDRMGILTADHRTSWASNYQAFVGHSLQNAKYVETIEQAAFILCLDEAAPENAEQRARQIHFGDGSNRWFDKSIQFVVCSNGVSGIVADHTGLDAPTVQDLNMLIAAAIRDYEPKEPVNKSEGLMAEELLYTSIPGIETEIQRVKMNFEAAIGGQQHFFPGPLPYGASLVKQHKLPPNSVFQLVVQVAAFHYFGYTPATWETVLQSTFHKGRVEINQIVSEQVAAFVKAAVDSETPPSTCRQLLTEAARTHSGTVLACTRAGGSDRFLTILREMVEEGEEEPELYKDPVYKRARPRKLMSSCFKTHMAENGCFMKDGNAVWLHFEVDPDSVKFCAVGKASETARFSKELERAAETVRRILEA